MRSVRLAVLPALCAVAFAGPKEDLELARRLANRGHTEMAHKLLMRLAASPDSAAARGGKFGLALLKSQAATRARLQFERALAEGEAPPVSREEIIRLYEEALPDVQRYVDGQADDFEAKFELAGILLEFGEFLTGSYLDEEQLEQRKKLLETSRERAEALFGRAIKEYEAVFENAAAVVRERKIEETNDPVYVRMTRADYGRALALFRWGLALPPGSAAKKNKIQEASERLDQFQAEHFQDLFGVDANLRLGQCSLELAVDGGSKDHLDEAMHYFEALFTDEHLKDTPELPDVGRMMAEAFFRYARACVIGATGQGKLKPQPALFEKAVRAGLLLESKLGYSGKTPFALRARLEVARAHAALGRNAQAIALAGSVLEAARASRLASIQAEAVALLSQWLAGGGGATTVDPSLFLQIGDALAAQKRFGRALAAYGQAIASSRTPEQRERVAYAAWRSSAAAYRQDRRPWAAAKAASVVVDAFVKSGQPDDSTLGRFAEDACYTAVLALKEIADATKAAEDQAEYDRLLALFRERFPGHPANADTAYQVAVDLLGKGELDKAVEAFQGISPSSRNYWTAQRLVPQVLREIGRRAGGDAAKAKAAYERCLEAATRLVEAAGKAGDVPAAKSALQYGRVLRALALADLGRWPEALEAIDAYLAAYPGQFLFRGSELDVKARAHLAAQQYDQAEAALDRMIEFEAQGQEMPYRASLNFDVYRALHQVYQGMESGAARTAMAARAARRFDDFVKGVKEPTSSHFFTLGGLYEDAGRWAEAGDAFQAAADAERDAARAAGYKLKAAEMKFRAAQPLAATDRTKYLEVLAETQTLFTDVLLPDKSNQAAVLKALGNPAKYPSRQDFDALKKIPDVLYTAAQVFAESSPPDVDGRWVAIRLLDQLTQITKPTPDENDPLFKYRKLWWDAVELRIRIYIAIAESGRGDLERKAGQAALSSATQLLLTYNEMDGEERVQRIRELKGRAERLK
jgi:hypothetical protein